MAKRKSDAPLGPTLQPSTCFTDLREVVPPDGRVRSNLGIERWNHSIEKALSNET